MIWHLHALQIFLLTSSSSEIQTKLYALFGHIFPRLHHRDTPLTCPPEPSAPQMHIHLLSAENEIADFSSSSGSRLEVCVLQSPLHPSCTSPPSQPKCGGIFGSAQLCSHAGPHAHSSPTCPTVLQVASTCNKKRETLKPTKAREQIQTLLGSEIIYASKDSRRWCQRRTC